MKKISTVLKLIRDKYRIDEKIELYSAVRDWEGIVGPELAGHTKPLCVQDRVLYIETEGAAWTQEISFRRKMIIDGVNGRLGRPHVREIRCQAGGEELPRKR